MRVGVSWWGGALAQQIHNRSVPLETFEALFRVPGVQFVNMQHGSRDAAARESLSRHANVRTDAVDPYQDLDGWFDLIASLDLLISVDNSNVHFAGALGVRTWLLLPDHPNWRWPQAGDVPWYESVDMIRKKTRDWRATIDAVAKRLNMSANPGGGRTVAA